MKEYNCLHKMKELHSIPIDKFTIRWQQALDKLLRFITVIRQKSKIIKDPFIGGKLIGYHSTNNLKTSNDCGVSLRSIE